MSHAERLTKEGYGLDNGPINLRELEPGDNIAIVGDDRQQLALVVEDPGGKQHLPLCRVNPVSTSRTVREALVREPGCPVRLAGTSVEDSGRVPVELRPDPDVSAPEIVKGRHLLVRYIDPRHGWLQTSLFRVADAFVS